MANELTVGDIEDYFGIYNIDVGEVLDELRRHGDSAFDLVSRMYDTFSIVEESFVRTQNFLKPIEDNSLVEIITDGQSNTWAEEDSSTWVDSMRALSNVDVNRFLDALREHGLIPEDLMPDFILSPHIVFRGVTGDTLENVMNFRKSFTSLSSPNIVDYMTEIQEYPRAGYTGNLLPFLRELVEEGEIGSQFVPSGRESIDWLGINTPVVYYGITGNISPPEDGSFGNFVDSITSLTREHTSNFFQTLGDAGDIFTDFGSMLHSIREPPSPIGKSISNFLDSVDALTHERTRDFLEKMVSHGEDILDFLASLIEGRVSTEWFEDSEGEWREWLGINDILDDINELFEKIVEWDWDEVEGWFIELDGRIDDILETGFNHESFKELEEWIQEWVQNRLNIGDYQTVTEWVADWADSWLEGLKDDVWGFVDTDIFEDAYNLFGAVGVENWEEWGLDIPSMEDILHIDWDDKLDEWFGAFSDGGLFHETFLDLSDSVMEHWDGILERFDSIGHFLDFVSDLIHNISSAQTAFQMMVMEGASDGESIRDTICVAMKTIYGGWRYANYSSFMWWEDEEEFVNEVNGEKVPVGVFHSGGELRLKNGTTITFKQLYRPEDSEKGYQIYTDMMERWNITTITYDEVGIIQAITGVEVPLVDELIDWLDGSDNWFGGEEWEAEILTPTGTSTFAMNISDIFTDFFKPFMRSNAGNSWNTWLMFARMTNPVTTNF